METKCLRNTHMWNNMEELSKEWKANKKSWCFDGDWMLGWFGLAERMENNRLVKGIMKLNICGARLRGRSFPVWMKCVQRALNERKKAVLQAKVVVPSRGERRDSCRCVKMTWSRQALGGCVGVLGGGHWRVDPSYSVGTLESPLRLLWSQSWGRCRVGKKVSLWKGKCKPVKGVRLCYGWMCGQLCCGGPWDWLILLKADRLSVWMMLFLFDLFGPPCVGLLAWDR